MSVYLRADTLIIRPMRQDDLEQVGAIDRISFSIPWPKKAFLANQSKVVESFPIDQSIATFLNWLYASLIMKIL